MPELYRGKIGGIVPAVCRTAERDFCAGDFSEMMRRQGATGDDWSDWDAHLPASPGSFGQPEALSSISMSRSLSKQTSDKFEAGEGRRQSAIATV